MGVTNPSPLQQTRKFDATSQAGEKITSLTLTYFGVIYSKKNSKRIIINRRTKRPMIVSNENAKQMEDDMAKQFSDAYCTLSPIAQPFATICGKPLKITIEIWQKNRIRRDLDNQATSVLDALVAGGVIIDDSADVIQELTIKIMGVDKHHPRATVQITAKGGVDV